MAESILYNIAGTILTQLGSSTAQELEFLWGANDELHKLKHTLSAIQAVLLDAEEQQFKNHAVKDWVSKLKDVLYEIEDMMDESNYETLRRQIMAKDRRKRKQVRMLFSKFKSNLHMAHKIKDIRQRLTAINEDKTQFSFANRVLDTVHDEFKKKRETYSFILEEEVIGRNDDKEAIIKLLLDTTMTKEDIAIISIVGMGGLGKTTLTQSVYNNKKMTKHFELKLWVCVSEEFDVKIIGEKIIESATKKKPESFLQMDSLQSELRKQIEGKKYLLVMDDVWNEDHEKWVSLKRLLMVGAKGSRILITTRDVQVAKTFDTTFLHSLQILDDSNSWLLFKKIVFLGGQEKELENSNLVKIGKEIVAKLRGVPLAIRTIGRLLREKNSQIFWLSFKDKELYQVMGQGKSNDLNYMRSILELSYKHLPPNLKKCFLYCALFPKDYRIEKDELILQWRAQGFIPPNDKDELIDIGENYFLELLSKSFFQEVTKNELGNINTCKMHDLMHDLACLITKNECIHGLKNDIDKRTHHFSFSGTSYEESKALRETLPKARNLRTFIMLQNYLDGWELDLGKFFQDHLQLRTIKIVFDGKEKFFKSIIGRFKHLRYLNLPSLDFKDLPNCITELYTLETLNLTYWASLERLPNDIKYLINLKHLNLFLNKSLECLPNSITELSKLETLNLYGCIKLKELPRDVKNWISLRHLNLGNSGMEFLPNSITQLNNLETLLLFNCSNLRALPEDIRKLINLKHLDTAACTSFTRMPKGLGELTNLQTLNEFVLGENDGAELSELNGLNKLINKRLNIRNLQFCSVVGLPVKAKFLQQKSGLQRLRLNWKSSFNESTIDNLDDAYERVLDCLQPHSNLEHLLIVGYGGAKLCNWLSSGCLVSVCLVDCKRLQHLPQFDQLPHLKQLSLEDLPNIEYMSRHESISSTTFFPSLKRLNILRMPKLKRWWKGTTSFSITFIRLSELKIFYCHLHILILWHAPSLKSMTISTSNDEHHIEEDEFDVVPWEHFENLTSLRLLKVEYLPKCLLRVTTLQCLFLWECENLKSLPEWINNLTSLTDLYIQNCKKLISLPQGICHMHSLQSLHIGGCPILEQRCKKDTGEDWPKIAHISNVYILGKRQ